jgi:photosystem II stability/assembly factor-like uncharacterized protein
MKFYYYLLFISIVFCTSCGKDKESSPPSTPPPQDSLYTWKKKKIQNNPIFDIWFVSQQKGFYLDSNSIKITTNGGLSWQVVHQNFYGINLFFTDEFHGFAQGANKFAITTDGGNTWINKASPSPNPLDIFFTSATTGFFTTDTMGLYKTTNAGTSWSKVSSLTNNSVTGIYFFDNNTGFIGNGQFRKTIDGGSTWEDTGLGLGGNANRANRFSVLQFTGPNTAWYGNYAGVFKYTERTNKWVNVFRNQSTGEEADLHFINELEGYYVSQRSIYKTADGGNSWELSCKLVSGFFVEIYFIDANNGWACTTDGAILFLKQ